MMLLVKAVPEGIRDKEFERFALQERPPAPYVPEKDPIQETVSSLKSDQSLKMTIREDAELCLPIWPCATREAFLMHVSTALDAIEKRGTFMANKEAQEAYWSNTRWRSKQRLLWLFYLLPLARARKIPRRLLGRTALRKRRLLR
jgi:hypothetical protein